jgi:hypothetical protein
MPLLFSSEKHVGAGALTRPAEQSSAETLPSAETLASLRWPARTRASGST